MNTNLINKTMKDYILNKELSGAGIIIRKNDEIIYKKHWGLADIATKQEINEDSIYRLASMTKCITAVAILKQMEEGRINIDDPVSKYIPEFANRRVVSDPKYKDINPKLIVLKLPFFKLDKVKTVEAEREITIRDLLSHASGLEQGLVGFLALFKMDQGDKTLKDRVMRYTNYPLDFQPGSQTSYSPLAAFDILGYIVGQVSGEDLEHYLTKEIFLPLGMTDTCFFPDREQEERVVRLYKRKKGKLIDVSDSKDDLIGIMRQRKHRFTAGSGGLFGTLEDYDRFVRMLSNEGMHEGERFLSVESVRMLHTEAQQMHLEFSEGCSWGLSVLIRQDPGRANSPVSEGTYGWSGACGTHFFISPLDKLQVVFMTNRSDLNGSASYISKKIEELVFMSKEVERE